MPKDIGYGSNESKRQAFMKELRKRTAVKPKKDKFDKPSVVDKVLYKTAQAQTQFKKLLKRKPKKSSETVKGSQMDVLKRNLSEEEIARFRRK
jgi:cytochrome c556